MTHVAAAGWYASGMFWSAAAVVVAVIVGIVTAVSSQVTAFPKRQLFYSMPMVAPLSGHSGAFSHDIELSQDGAMLKNPHLVELELIGRGRLDIPSDRYDKRRPISFDIGTRIVEILRCVSLNSPLSPPKVSINSTAVRVGPSLIGKRQRIRVMLLTDGYPPGLKCESSLIDVKVDYRYVDSDEWVMANRIGIRLVAFPFIYGGLVLVWLHAGTSAAFIYWLSSSIIIYIGIFVVIGTRRIFRRRRGIPG